MTSGSDTRQRTITLSARFTGEEAALVREAADRAGVAVASLIRMALLDEPRARATRRPPAAAALVARLLHELGPVADNLRQIAADPAGAGDPRLPLALEQLGDMSFVCLQSLGRAPAAAPALPFPASVPEPLSAIWARACAIPDARPRQVLPFPRMALS